MPAATTASSIASSFMSVLATPSKSISQSIKSMNMNSAGSMGQVTLLTEPNSSESFSNSDDDLFKGCAATAVTSLEDNDEAIAPFSSNDDNGQDEDDNDDDQPPDNSFLRDINPARSKRISKIGSGSSHGANAMRRQSERVVPKTPKRIPSARRMRQSSERDVLASNGDNNRRRANSRRANSHHVPSNSYAIDDPSVTAATPKTPRKVKSSNVLRLSTPSRMRSRDGSSTPRGKSPGLGRRTGSGTNLARVSQPSNRSSSSSGKPSSLSSSNHKSNSNRSTSPTGIAGSNRSKNRAAREMLSAVSRAEQHYQQEDAPPLTPLGRSASGPSLSTLTSTTTTNSTSSHTTESRKKGDSHKKGNDSALAFIALIDRDIQEPEEDDYMTPPLTSLGRSTSVPVVPYTPKQCTVPAVRYASHSLISNDTDEEENDHMDDSYGEGDEAFLTPKPRSSTVTPTLQSLYRNPADHAAAAAPSRTTPAVAPANTTTTAAPTSSGPAHNKTITVTMHQGQLILPPIAPYTWKCHGCDLDMSLCMKFCGKCATPKHWSCGACQFDQNPCAFAFCGMCGTGKPVDNHNGKQEGESPVTPVKRNSL